MAGSVTVRRTAPPPSLTTKQKSILDLVRTHGKPIEMNGDYTRLRLVKSDEEIEWVRTAAGMTDQSLRALHDAAKPGVTEVELADVIERAYVAQGGTTHIHYLGTTSMARPALCVPRQYPSTRRLAPGHVLVCELSASYWDYTGQILRTVAIAARPCRKRRAKARLTLPPPATKLAAGEPAGLPAVRRGVGARRPVGRLRSRTAPIPA